MDAKPGYVERVKGHDPVLPGSPEPGTVAVYYSCGCTLGRVSEEAKVPVRCPNGMHERYMKRETIKNT